MNKEKIERLWKELLIEIGEDPNREGLKETPKRIAKMYEEIFRGYDKEQLPKVTTFNNGVDGIVYDQMVTDTGSYYSCCEHHQIPFFGTYYFGVIYHPQGKILGISKVARVVDYFSAKMQIQERLVHEIVEYLWKELSKNGVKPLGMVLWMQGEHLCKTMRGVKKKGEMTTCVMKGAFKENPETRNEFMRLIK